MAFGFLKRWKFWRRLLIWSLIAPILLFFTVVAIVYWNQDAIVQKLITDLNDDFIGEIEIEDSHVSPFENFPYISITLDNVKFYEDKQNHKDPIVSLENLYAGFDLWTLISGSSDIKVLEFKEGYIHVVQHTDGEFNIVKALTSSKPIEEVAEDFNIHLKSIELINVDIYKLNESNGLIVESFVDHADLSFKSNEDHVLASINAQMEMNIIKNGDTTFFKHKHLNINSEVEYLKETEMVLISPSELELEHSTFTGEGSIDIKNDYDISLNLYGKKKNFELFMSLAPEELHPTLAIYDNAGDIEFDVSINGKAINGNTPDVYAVFVCENAHFENNLSHKKLDKLSFSGYYTNNGLPGLENMEFKLSDFAARPEAGTFTANLFVKNFDAPDIEMSLDSDFDLEFLTSFINVTSFEDLEGSIQMHMKFHDIIDLAHPERSIEKLNEAYSSEILIENVGFKSADFHLPISKLNTRVVLEGHAAEIEYFTGEIGGSDINISGHISDLPAILHHTDEEVTADLIVESKLLDILEMTTTTDPEAKPIDEKIEDFKMKLKFVSTARNFTESKNLPVGEFFIEDLYADLDHYPHTLHDFHADIFVNDSNFRIINFSGMIDKSDFHFIGQLLDYERWLEEHPKGDTKINFDLTSTKLHLEDVFSYKGENYVPEDYRHEILDDLKLHGSVKLHFNEGLQSTDFKLTEVAAKMEIHPVKFEDFDGRIHIEDEHVVIEELAGKIGHSVFSMDMNYYFGDDEAIRKRDNHFGMRAMRLDFDELFNYNTPPGELAKSPEEHEAGFNIYELPFSTMTFDLDIDRMNYRRYLLDDIHARLRTTPEHYIYIDTMRLKTAGGRFELAGYFNGSDKDKIYFSPNLKLIGVDLDKLLFKFENFGQDHLVSENLHGEITTTITGKVHVHADFVPILDDSEVHMDVEILKGTLVDFAPLVEMQEYFVDKNVNKVKFDSLRNHVDFTNGTINILEMAINSSLGYMIISGTQDMDYNMEYYIRVPLSLVASTGFKKLFGKNKEEVDPEQEDDIEYADADKKRGFVNIRIVGDADDYKITLGKDKRKRG
ncbi:MAG: AsmA-like C-terminal region-containing protein [Crocinitomix sp.]|nr:AsmA-like C-terminal region-containing protein [Crocinitomix sp.]